MPKYDIEVQLTGEDGNAFAIMGRVSRELRRAGATQEELTEYRKESTSGDYNHLLAVAGKWVHIL